MSDGPVSFQGKAMIQAQENHQQLVVEIKKEKWRVAITTGIICSILSWLLSLLPLGK